MASREELIKAAKEKFERDQLIAAAQAKWQSENTPKDESVTSDQVETGIRSALEGATFGLTEPVISGANAVIGNAIDAGFDSEGLMDFLSKATDSDRIKNAYNSDVERRRTLENEYANTALVSEIGGALVSPVGNKVAAGLGKAGGAAVKMIPGAEKLLQAGNVVGPAARVGQGFAEGASTAVGSELLKRVIETPTGFIQPQDEQGSLTEMALLGGKFGSGMKAVPEIASAVGSASKNMLSAFGGVKPQTIDKYLEKADDIRNAKSPADAKELVDQAVANIQDNLATQKGDYVDEVIGAVDQLKQKVVEGSKQAYQILDGVDDKINVDQVQKSIQQAKKGLMVAGRAPVGKAAQGAVSSLDQYAETFKQLPKEITLSEAKQILQQMDDDINYINKAGEFGSRGSNALSSVRSSLDDIVKTMSPAYENQMKQVSQDARALSELSEKFGTPDKIYSKMNALGDNKSPILNQALEKLENSTGANLSSRLSQIQEATPIARMNPQGTENFIKSVMNGTSIENRKKLQLLSKLSDQDLVSLVDNSGVAEAFNKEFRAGSQHVNLWTVVGLSALGGFTGDQVGGSTGAMTGAVLGSLTTKFGPAATRKILDGYSKINGSPTVRKISQVMGDLPPNIQDELKADLVRAATMYSQDTKINIRKEDYKQTLLDIDASQNMTSVEKAKAIDSLNRTGQMDSKYLRKAMIDTGEILPQPQIKTNDNIRKPVQSGVRLDQVSDFIKQKRREEF